MTRDEFKRRLLQLQETILRACCFHRGWIMLQFRDDNLASWTLEELNRMLGRFPGFFNNVVIAMQEASLLNFAKVFETNPRTASLSVLLTAARNEPSLVPGRSVQELREFSRKLKQARGTLRGLEQARNQRLAHADANPDPSLPILKKDLDALSLAIEEIYNGLSAGHDGNVYSWDYMLERADSDTEVIMTIIMKDMDRRRAEAEAAVEASRA